MALSISKALNIQNDERSVVFLLLAQSVFLGIFAGALDVGANSLFLEAYSADLMPRAFMISGVVGIVFTSVYTWMQKRMNFKLFTIINLVIAILVTGALRFGYSSTDEDWLSFALLVMMGPVIIISMLGFWGTAGRYFTLREGKRLFGIIDTGSIVGMILAFYAVPLLVRINFNVYDTLSIGAVSLVLALLFQIIVLSKHKLPVAAEKKEKTEKKKGSGFMSIFRRKYTRMMAFFVMLSVITGFFIHYTFMWATEANYPDSRELSGFLGAFFGTMMIATVVIKSTLYGWLMKNFGLRVTLVITPVLLLVLTVVASVIGGVFGYETEAGVTTFFFLLMALSKLFNRSLKDAIESPSMKILYQSLDAKERFDVQARVDGIVNELTAFSTGVLMAGLLMMSFIDVIHFSYILVIVLGLWTLLGFALYRSYRKTLNDTLAATKDSQTESDAKLTSEPVYEDSPMFAEAVELNPYFNFRVSGAHLEHLLTIGNESLKAQVWKAMLDTVYKIDSEIVDQQLASSNSLELKKIIQEYKRKHQIKGKDLQEAFRSHLKEDKIGALLETVHTKDHSQLPNLISLLRDKDREVRFACIEAAGMLKLKELGAYLVDYLGHEELYEVTWASMVRMGEEGLDSLENAFHKTGVSSRVQLRIVKAIAAIGGERAKQLLFAKIQYHQRAVREAVVKGLNENAFEATEAQMPILQDVIYELCYAGAWNVAAIHCLQEYEEYGSLKTALEDEKHRNDILLFEMLEVAYDQSAVAHVKNSFMDPEIEDTGFALELLNIIVDEQVVLYLEPYFDELPIPDKIRKLQNEMPVEILGLENLLPELINRDAMFAGNYSKLCAIEVIQKQEGLDATKYLAAQVFHSNYEISVASLNALAIVDSNFYEKLRQRGNVRSVEEGFSVRGIIERIEGLKSWPSFGPVSFETLFELYPRFVPEAVNDSEKVSFVRNSQSRGAEVIQEGCVCILTNYPLLLKEVEELMELPGFEMSQMSKKSFREFIFDNSEFGAVCEELFRNKKAKVLNVEHLEKKSGFE